MPDQATHNQLPVYVNNTGRGFFTGLGFPDPLEAEFRKYYSRTSVSRARLMPGFAAMMIMIGVVLRFSGDDPSLFLTIWDLGFVLPLLFVTLYLSTLPHWYRAYQRLLHLSGLISGIVIVSMYFRPTLEGMPSYFAMVITWVLGIWLILGLRFAPAAVAALMVSSAHIAGIIYIDYEYQVLGFEIVMLFLVNGIGAICCYQIENTTRRSFSESLELEELARELTVLSELDGLTGLNNRRTYDAYIDKLWRQSKREQTLLTIIIVDIDYFKDYNDHYGHQNGDKALKAVAGVISRCAKRPFDFAARYGGEEFVLALYGSYTDPNLFSGVEFGHVHAEAIRENILALEIEHVESKANKYLTVSVGVAVVLPDTKRSLAGAVQMADEALYRAKEEGRNRAVVVECNDYAFRTGRFRTGKFRAPKVAAS